MTDRERGFSDRVADRLQVIEILIERRDPALTKLRERQPAKH